MENTNATLIELKDVSKSFQLESGSMIKVLRDISARVGEHEIVALLGPSGSGKSTCLRIMSGLIEPTTGEVLVHGAPLHGTNLDVALVFQSFALFPWETIFANIALALRPLHLEEAEVRSRVKRVIDLVGLEGFEEAYPRELSGGMKQRVGIARALVMDRPILFLDEPFSALDVLTADTLRAEMVNIFVGQKTSTRSMVVVTHNIQEAVIMANRILVMGTNPGIIRREFANALPFPRDPESDDFKSMVTQIHALITETLMPDAVAPAVGSAIVGPAPVEPIPHAQINETIGLIEAVADRGGRVPIFELSTKIGLDFGKTLVLVKAAEMLELVDTPKQMIILTAKGQQFADGDNNVRKQILHESLKKLGITKLVAEFLRQQRGGRVSRRVLARKIAEWLPNENAKKTIDTVVAWGRFAELLGFSADSKEVYLDTGQDAV